MGAFHYKILYLYGLTIPLIKSEQPIKIGAIFDENNLINIKAFDLAAKNIGAESLIEFVSENNYYNIIETTNFLLDQEVQAILAPKSREIAQIVQSICDERDIPVLDIHPQSNPAVINMYPAQKKLLEAYLELLKNWDYKDFIVLYDEEKSLVRAVELFKLYNGKQMILKQLDKHKNGNYRATLKEAWKSGATRFVLDCSIDILEEVLRQAQQIGLITNQHHFFITNLDFQTIDFTSFQYSECNITGVRFLNPAANAVTELSSQLFDTDGLIAAWQLKLETALIIDAVTLLGKALQKLPKNSKGSTVMNLIKGSTVQGVTGVLLYDTLGERTTFALDILELKEGGITKVATWNSTQGLNVTRFFSKEDLKVEGSLFNKTFVVITALTEPYGMQKESAVPLYGNSRYEGFGVDLIHELSLRLGFNYTFIIREDKKNGEYDDTTKQWDGMIGDIISKHADLAITDLTITSERADAVDFTATFMNLGISILYQKAKKAPPSFFSFADPFSVGVWKLLTLACLGTSLALFILGRLSPSEWQNPYPCVEQPEYLINQLSLRNCFWFMAGSLMQQGSEVAPIAVSTRMVGGVWWFFTLIMVSSYTANLAAFLTTETPNNAFNDVYELTRVAEKKGIKFGAKINGSTAKFFSDSKHIEEYQKIYQYMRDYKDEVMVGDNKLGVLKAEKENYAFFMETTSIEYETQRRCSLVQIGRALDEKGYGIAMRKNSSYRFALSTTILKLHEDGVIAKLKRKWWQESRGGGQCPEDAENAAATALNLKNVGGVFWVTIIGSLLSLVVVFIEILFHSLKKSFLNNSSLREEIQFYFHQTGLIKPEVYS